MQDVPLLHERVACKFYHSNMTSLKMTSKILTVSSSNTFDFRCLQVPRECHSNTCYFPSWKDDFISTLLVDAETNTYPPPYLITEKHSTHGVMNNIFSLTPFSSKRMKCLFLHPFEPYIHNQFLGAQVPCFFLFLFFDTKTMVFVLN